MPGSARAISVLPAPGGPTMITLCPPAAATSIARLTCSCPRTSCKSVTASGNLGRGQRAHLRGNRRDAVQVIDQVGQAAHRHHVHARDQRGLGGVFGRDEQALELPLACQRCDGEHAANMTHRAIEAQFAHDE